MYRVIEVANMLGVSKVTIYKKISLFKKDLKPYLHKKRNITFIDEEGVKIIRESLVANQVIADDSDKDEKIRSLEDAVNDYESHLKFINEKMIDVQREHMEDLQLLVSTLKAQTNLKKSQIESKHQIIKNFKDLVAYNKEQIKRIEDKMSLFEG